MFCMPSFRIWAMTLDILTEGFHGFPESLHANAGIVSRLGHGIYLPCLLQFIIQPSSCCLTLCGLITAGPSPNGSHSISLQSDNLAFRALQRVGGEWLICTPRRLERRCWVAGANRAVTPSPDVSSSAAAVNLHARVLKSTQILTATPTLHVGAKGNHFNKLFACRGKRRNI
jgi:hypothetical protein